jgi:mono/diheme cytochrome c family protein
MRRHRSPARSSLRAAPLTWALLLAACTGGNDAAIVSSAADVEATLKRYCADCHNPAEFSGGFAVADLDASAVHEDPELWERVVRKLRTRTMPPQDALRPEPVTYDSLATWLAAALDAAAAEPRRAGAAALERASMRTQSAISSISRST